MANITLLTRDGARFEFPCAETDNILDAAEAAGLYLPAMCHEGTCGACNAHVSDGHYVLAPVGGTILADTSSNGCHSCRCRPEGELIIDAPYSQVDIHRHKIPRRAATIVSLTPAGSGALALTLALAEDPEPAPPPTFPVNTWKCRSPGTTIRRAYSMGNLPNWDGRLDFLDLATTGRRFLDLSHRTGLPGRRASRAGTVRPFHARRDERSTALFDRRRLRLRAGLVDAPASRRFPGHAADDVDLCCKPGGRVVRFRRHRRATEQPAEAHNRAQRLASQGPWPGFTGTAAEAFAATLDHARELPDVYVFAARRPLESVLAVAGTHGVPPARIFTEQVQPR